VRCRQNLGRPWSLGARIVPGTDAGVGPGKPHDVLPYAVAALTDLGMSPLDAQRACGVAGRKGSLRPGADADLLAVRGDPTTDAGAIHDVVGVCVAGTRIR
jgi:imidazolonepropionase-like amidohydrolase